MPYSSTYIHLNNPLFFFNTVESSNTHQWIFSLWWFYYWHWPAKHHYWMGKFYIDNIGKVTLVLLIDSRAQMASIELDLCLTLYISLRYFRSKLGFISIYPA